MKKIKENNKIILFPGLIENNVESAVQAVERMQYKKAIDILEGIIPYLDTDDEFILSLYIHCLYETKNYKQAKIVCEDLIALQPENYFDVMELYLTICIQLKENLQVDKIIQSLFEENIISDEKKDIFKRIQALNEEIANNKQRIEVQDEYSQEVFSAKDFLSQSDIQKLVQIQQLSTLNIRPFVQELIHIVQNKEVHPFIQSLILILLVEQQVDMGVTISKFDNENLIQLSSLKLPTELPQYEQIQKLLVNRFEDDPTKAELVLQLLAKHAIVCFPYEWAPFKVDEVAEAYYRYVEEMFGNVENTKNDVFQFIEQLEKLSELQ